MGATHYIDPTMKLPDALASGVSHELELYRQGNGLYLRLWVGGVGAGNGVICLLTKKQAEQLADSAASLAVSIG